MKILFILTFSLLSNTLLSQISVNGNQLKNLASPTDPADAVNLQYILQLENQIEQMDLNIDNDCDGFTENQGDCNDNDKSIGPENLEIIDDGIDNDCDGLIDEYVFNEIDDDGDGYNEINGDCDDSNINVYPGNDEIQDGLDNNCNGEIDEIIGNEIDSINNLLNDIDNNKAFLMTVNQLKNNYLISGETYEFTSEIVLKGYVVSNDSSDNFYKEIYIQDDPRNPTGGIRILIDQTDLHKKYNFGREIYINLKGLHIGEYRTGDGVVSIGELDDNQNRLSNIRSLKSLDHIFRSDITNNIEPLNLIFSEINDDHIGTYVSISNVNVEISQIGKPFVDKYDSIDTQRTLETCEDFIKSTFNLETEAFASFRDVPLPSGSGTIRGVVTKTYNGDNLVLKLNSPNDMNFNGEVCSVLNIDDFEIVLDETFDNVVDNSNFDYNGWVNYAEIGGELWTEQFYSGNGYVEFKAYNSGDDVNIGWLVTPAFDLTGASNAYINFKLAQNHLDDEENNTLEVFVSTDFDGSDVLAANWDKINVNIPGQDVSWYAFQDVGLVNVSSYSGNLYVAFKYIGSGNDTSLDGGYWVDDILFIKD